MSMSTSASSPLLKPSAERTAELKESLSEVRARVQRAAAVAVNDHNEATPRAKPTLVAVSKYKPASDILACYEDGQLDFGENYVQELVDKAEQLPSDIQWHFIGTLQSNKAKILASIPNLYAVQTISSTKLATALNKALPETRTEPLNVFLQVNTSGEDNKSGLPPLSSPSSSPSPSSSSSSSTELTDLAKLIVTTCPKLRLQGLMTIGSLSESLCLAERPNEDFERLKRTRDLLQEVLRASSEGEGEGEGEGGRGRKWEWGRDGRLLLSMGMSSDFEVAVKSGSDVVRVGTSIFGARSKKVES